MFALNILDHKVILSVGGQIALGKIRMHWEHKEAQTKSVFKLRMYVKKDHRINEMLSHVVPWPTNQRWLDTHSIASTHNVQLKF